MPEEPQDKQEDLWSRVLQAIQEKVPTRAFDTWFRPIVFAGSRVDAFELIVPNETFRRALLENFSDILDDILTRIVATSCRLKVSVQAQDIASAGLSSLPVVRASELESDAGNKPWLIERLWSIQAVGFVSGPPKSFKTWTVLEMAVSVASGAPCLGVFPVHRSGPVLLYAAEDPMTALRLRLESLARNHGLDLEQVDIRVIRADSLRLDRPGDREKLAATIDLHRPALLILDPLVRLHALDENQAGPMAELLSHIRALQRSSGTAIAIVHHSRKDRAHSAGQSMRGSSDLYAFVDSLVSLQRRHGRVVLSAEHRSAPALAPLPLELVAAAQPDRAPSLRIAKTPDEDPPKQNLLEERIIKLLSESHSVCTTDSIRVALQVRKQRLLEALRNLSAQGVIRREGNRYTVTPNQKALEIK
ncbi:MAG: AAA family ATPase [Acidobacteria bacterium]|nr:AAA family ATPase [Acidobacteriota bacterium]